jgi:UDP-N-acetylmuramoyl-L-alanyl-D-glutamate--2,6-diaminopimelate ligase
LPSTAARSEPGTLFAALPGTQVHGARFIAGAIADGAAAILTDREGAEIAAEALSGRTSP